MQPLCHGGIAGMGALAWDRLGGSEDEGLQKEDEDPRDLWGRDAGAPRSLLSLLGPAAPPPGRRRTPEGIPSARTRSSSTTGKE